MPFGELVTMSSHPTSEDTIGGARRLPIDLVLPHHGIAIAQEAKHTPVLCKPKIMPLKSEMLKKLDEEQRQQKSAAREDAGGGSETSQVETAITDAS
eukprot:m.111238 g.111238  ORF g.111238 m.111238 type:complete len:97 (-) comp17002_c0_seq3:411-701(-)